MIKTKTANKIADELHKVVRDISEPSTYLDKCIRIRDKKYVAVDDVMNEFDSFMDALTFILESKIDDNGIKEIQKEYDTINEQLRR